MNCYCDICKNKKPFDMPEQIIEAALDNKLVFFCGAGVSTENRNVLPITFYESIKNDISSCQSNIPFSQLMQKYCELPDGRRKLLKKFGIDSNTLIPSQSWKEAQPHFTKN